jgi:hypothetical protein
MKGRCCPYLIILLLYGDRARVALETKPESFRLAGQETKRLPQAGQVYLQKIHSGRTFRQLIHKEMKPKAHVLGSLKNIDEILAHFLLFNCYLSDWK